MASTVLKVLRRLGLRDDPNAKKPAPKKKAPKKVAKKRLGFTRSTKALKTRTERELEKLGL